jgi:hypothetical protein
MRCLACGAEMVLMNVVPDDTMAVAGFEHHTFMCSGCDDVERRLIFNKHEPIEHDPAPILEHESDPILIAPAVAPTMLRQSERAAAPGILRRMFSILRGGADARR